MSTKTPLWPRPPVGSRDKSQRWRLCHQGAEIDPRLPRKASPPLPMALRPGGDSTSQALPPAPTRGLRGPPHPTCTAGASQTALECWTAGPRTLGRWSVLWAPALASAGRARTVTPGTCWGSRDPGAVPGGSSLTLPPPVPSCLAPCRPPAVLPRVPHVLPPPTQDTGTARPPPPSQAFGDARGWRHGAPRLGGAERALGELGFGVALVRTPDEARGPSREPRWVLGHPDRPASRLKARRANMETGGGGPERPLGTAPPNVPQDQEAPENVGCWLVGPPGAPGFSRRRWCPTSRGGTARRGT